MRETPIDDAFRQGLEASRVEGAASQLEYNPYDDDSEAALYKAWEKGFAFGLSPQAKVVHLSATHPSSNATTVRE